MRTELNIHEVTAIRLRSPMALSGAQCRYLEVETADGHVFRVIAFTEDSIGELAIEVEDQSEASERHLEAG